MSELKLKVVKLLEPELCLTCRFAKRATVETEPNKPQRMIYCQRRDCDNWDVQTFQPAIKVTEDGNPSSTL